MATRTWTGASQDGNFDTVGNWSAAVVPVTGDSIIVSRSATYGMTTNLDRDADGAGAGLNIVSFEIEKGFAYDIGSLTTRLKMTADKFTDNGNGNVYFESSTGTAGLDTDRVIIDKDDISKTVYLMGNAGLSDMTLIEVSRGANVYIGDGNIQMDVTTLWVAPRYQQSDVRVTGMSVSTIATVNMGGGEFIYDGIAVTTFNLGNGVLTFQDTGLTTLNQTGGLFLHNGEASNYTVTTYNAIAGFMDSTQSAGNKLITTLNRAPQWSMAYNPKLTVSTTNYIGG